MLPTCSIRHLFDTQGLEGRAPPIGLEPFCQSDRRIGPEGIHIGWELSPARSPSCLPRVTQVSQDIPVFRDFQRLGLRVPRQRIHPFLAPLEVLNRDCEHRDTLDLLS